MSPGALENSVLLACGLFAVGILGVTCRRNVLVMLLSVEIMLNAANLVLVAFSKVHRDVTGQVFVFFSMTVAAAEVAVGLAIVIAVYRLRRSTDTASLQDLHEVDYGPVPRLKLEGEEAHHAHDAHPHEAHPQEAGHPAEPAPEGHAQPEPAHAHATGGH